MQKEINYQGINFLFPTEKLNQAFDSCAEELSVEMSGMNKLQVSIRKGEFSNHMYSIDFRAVSDQSDFESSIETQNIFNGLTTLKNMTLYRIREDKKDSFKKSRRRLKPRKEREFQRPGPLPSAM